MSWTRAVMVGLLVQGGVFPLIGLAADPVSQALSLEQQALADQRERIEQVFTQAQQACWQKFAVTPCLIDARRARRQSLAPLQQQELQLNARERQWQADQRAQRLQDKLVRSRVTP